MVVETAAACETAGTAPSECIVDAVKPARLRVLLVEDNEFDAELVIREIERSGYAPVWERVDTRDAMMAALAERRWDFIIADHNMPHFSAPAALAALHESGLDVPFIIVSGSIEEDTAVAAMRAGAHDYVTKGRLARLGPAVQRELREAAIRGQHRRVEAHTELSAYIAKIVGGALDLGSALERVERRLAEALPCDCVATFFLDTDADIVRMVSQFGVPPELLPAAESLAFGPNEPTGGVLGSGKTLVLNDIDMQPYVPPELCSRFGVGALVAVPLHVRGCYHGVLAALNFTGERQFDSAQVELCEGVAHELGLALESIELFRAQQEEAEVSGALARVGREMISSLDTPVLLDRLCQATAEEIGCESSHTFLWRPEEDAFVSISAYGYSPEQWEVMRALRLPRAMLDGVLDRLEREEVAEVVIPDTPETPIGVLYRGFGVTAVLCVPLRRGEEMIGLHAACYRGRTLRFTRQQRRIASGIAQLASFALHNARLLEALDSANRLKSDFVATMSHELRTPLNVIMGYTDLLLNETFGPLPPEQGDALRRVDKNAHELFDLISATLDISRLETGRMPVATREVHVPKLLNEVDTETRPLQEKPGVQCFWNVAPDLPRLHTDPLKLKVVVKNLLSNGVKFTDQGCVTVAARATDGGVELSVSDTGVGMAPEVLPVIFEPFRQGDGSSTRRYGGVGLGLYVVRCFVDLLGGTINVESEVGRGSTFRVWLPGGNTQASGAEAAW
jgi:signal transduction histidine kinase/CheY-like chemotaxis protein